MNDNELTGNTKCWKIIVIRAISLIDLSLGVVSFPLQVKISNVIYYFIAPCIITNKRTIDR